MTLKHLEELTLAWSHERGILQNSNTITQGMKLVSEHGELVSNLCHYKDIKDDIGDCLVVLTNLANLTSDKMKLSECSIAFTPRPTATILGDLCDNIIKNNPITSNIHEMFNALYQTSLGEELTLEECWEVAYNDIKDRKGFLNTQGNFIKSTDKKYEQQLMDFEAQLEGPNV